MVVVELVTDQLVGLQEQHKLELVLVVTEVSTELAELLVQMEL